MVLENMLKQAEKTIMNLSFSNTFLDQILWDSELLSSL